MLVVHGGPNTVVARDRTGRPVVLLSGDPPEALTSTVLTGLLDLAAAVLTPPEMARLERCLTALRRGEARTTTRLEVDGLALTLYGDDPGEDRRAAQRVGPP